MANPPSPPALWTTEPDGYLEPQLSPSGMGSKAPMTVLQLFASTAAKHATQRAMCLKRPVNGVMPADWQVWTWKQYYADCVRFAKTLLHLGVDSYHVVNILGFNSPEWLIANCGAQLAACIAAGIYATNIADACVYVTGHSKAAVVVLEDNKQLAKYASRSAELPALKVRERERKYVYVCVCVWRLVVCVICMCMRVCMFLMLLLLMMTCRTAC